MSRSEQTVTITVVHCDDCGGGPLSTYYTQTAVDGRPLLDFCSSCWFRAYPLQIQPAPRGRANYRPPGFR